MTLFETIEDQDKKLGELLKEQNTITEEQIDVVIEKADELNKRFGETAVELGMLEEIEFLKALSQQQDLPFVDLKSFNIDRKALSQMDKETARKLLAIPFLKLKVFLLWDFMILKI